MELVGPGNPSDSFTEAATTAASLDDAQNAEVDKLMKVKTSRLGANSKLFSHMLYGQVETPSLAMPALR